MAYQPQEKICNSLKLLPLNSLQIVFFQKCVKVSLKIFYA